MKEQLLTTSAVGAVVVGFALQDTLGNLFAGLAIQIEKPFRVGHWISVAGAEGQVQEITWRATKLRTKAGQFLIVPNGMMSKEIDPQLLRADHSDAHRSRDWRQLRRAAQRREGGDSRGDAATRRWSVDAAVQNPAGRLRRIGDHLSRRSSGLATTPSTRRRAIRSHQSGTCSAAAASRFRTRFRFSSNVTSGRSDPKRHVSAEAVWARSICSRRLAGGIAPRAVAHREGAHLRAGEPIVRQGEGGSSMFVVLERPRPRRARARRAGSGGDSNRRILRRDVDADR